MTTTQKPSFSTLKNAHKKNEKANAKSAAGTETATTATAGERFNWEWPPEAIMYLKSAIPNCCNADKEKRNTVIKAAVDAMVVELADKLPSHGEARMRGDRFLRNAIARTAKTKAAASTPGVTFRKDRRQNAADLWAEQPDIKAKIRREADDELTGLAASEANRARPGKMSSKKADLWLEFTKEDPTEAAEWKERASKLAKNDIISMKDTIISNQSKLRSALDSYLSKMDGSGKRQGGPMTMEIKYGYIDAITGNVKTGFLSVGRCTPSGLSYPQFASKSDTFTASKEEFSKFSYSALKPLASEFLNGLNGESDNSSRSSPEVIDVDAEPVIDNGDSGVTALTEEVHDNLDATHVSSAEIFPTEANLINDNVEEEAVSETEPSVSDVQNIAGGSASNRMTVRNGTDTDDQTLATTEVPVQPFVQAAGHMDEQLLRNVIAIAKATSASRSESTSGQDNGIAAGGGGMEDATESRGHKRTSDEMNERTTNGHGHADSVDSEVEPSSSARALPPTVKCTKTRAKVAAKKAAKVATRKPTTEATKSKPVTDTEPTTSTTASTEGAVNEQSNAPPAKRIRRTNPRYIQ